MFEILNYSTVFADIRKLRQNMQPIAITMKDVQLMNYHQGERATKEMQAPTDDDWSDVGEDLDWETPSTGHSSLPVGKEGQTEIVRIIGARLKEARELCNLSQSEAARRLGYANPSKLSKIEAATDTNSVPLWLISRAADIYEVSVDFLFGRTDDWETGPQMTQEREVSAWLNAKAEEFRQPQLKALRALNDHLFELRSALGATHAAIREMDEALKAFIEANPQFEDMLGSNRLWIADQRALAAAERGDARMRKLKVDRLVEIS